MTRPFAASKYGNMLYNVAGSRRLSVSTMGESHGLAIYLGQAIQRACWRYFPADIVFDHRSYANGGSELAQGGTTTGGTNGLLDQVAQFEARPTDIAFIAAGYNDQPTTTSDLDTLTANVVSAATDVFAAGAKFVVIVGMTPRNITNAAAEWLGYNFRMRMWCAQTDGAFFLDVTSVIAERQNTVPSQVPYREIGTYASGAYNSYTTDGTHWARRSIHAIAPLVADIFQRICATRSPRLVHNAGDYHPANAPWGNILGDAGNMMGTSGMLNWSADSGVAGTSSTSRLNISPQGTGFTITPSIIPGAGGERVQRITLNGSTGAGGSPAVTVSCSPTITGVNGGVATRMMDVEAVVTLTGVTGLTNIQHHPPGGTGYRSVPMVNADDSNCWPDTSTEDLFTYTLFPIPVPSGNNPGFSLFFEFAAGKTLAGTIDISRWSAAIVDE